MNKRLVFLQLAVFIAAFCFSDFDSPYNLAIGVGALLASPVVGSAIGGLFSGIGSIFGSSSANNTQERIARENREWQSEENQLNRDFSSEQNQSSRDWQERMWNAQNAYNTPSAMMKRYSDAGMNPYLVGQNSAVGQAGAAGSPSQSSPTMVGSPNMPHTIPINYGAPIGDAVNLALQSKGVDANAANQRAQSAKSIVEAATDAFKTMGYKGFYSVLQTFGRWLGDSSPEGSYLENQAMQELTSMRLDNAQKELSFNLANKYSEKQIEQNMSKMEYDISEIVGRLNTMRITNEATLKRLAADLVVKAAEAWNLRKVGEKFEADAQTINAIRKYIIKSVRAQSDSDVINSRLLSDKLPFEEALIPHRYTKEGNQLDVTGSKASIFLDFVTDQIGDIYHVSYSSGNYKGSYQQNGTPFIESEWSQPNPFGGQTHYRARKY